MPYRVLMVAACPLPARRGTPLRVERLAESLAERGHAVEIATYDIAEVPDPMPVPVHRTGGRLRLMMMPPGPNLAKLRLDPKLAASVQQLLAGHRFDLVHAHHAESVLASAWACRRHGVPLIYDAHTLVASELPSYARFGRAALALAGGVIDRLACRFADGLVAVTDDIRDVLVAEGGLPPERVVVAANGVENDFFTNGGDITPEPGLVLYSGTAAPYQDLELLLEAFARARAVRPRLRLCLSVSGHFGALPAILDRLGLAGAVELVPDSFAALRSRLAACTAAVLPRTACYGIPQKLLNYMAAGRPVVASAGSAKLGRDGEHLLVVPNGDRDAFAAALVRLHDDPALAARLGRSARDLVSRHCTWQTTAEQVEQLYDRLIPQPLPHAAVTAVSQA